MTGEALGSEGRCRVLIVDDDVDSAEMLAQAIDAVGYEAQIANDGRGALLAADVFKPRVIVIDIGMPDMDGLELARRLRDRDATATFIALSGYDSSRHIEAAWSAGVAHYFVKPVELPEFVARLNTICRG